MSLFTDPQYGVGMRPFRRAQDSNAQEYPFMFIQVQKPFVCIHCFFF